MSKYEWEKKVGLEAVRSASSIAMHMQEKLPANYVINKEDHSPVTVADYSIQALINLYLLSAFSDIPIMGEEDSVYLQKPEYSFVLEKIFEEVKLFFPDFRKADVLSAIDKGNYKGSSSGRFWVLDPIDGTKGFIRNEQYAIALALIEDGLAVLSFLGCPKFISKKFKKDGIFVAEKNEGCLFIPYDGSSPAATRVNLSNIAEEAIYCEPSLLSRTHSHAIASKVAAYLHFHQLPLRLDSQCKYALVASAETSVYMRIPERSLHREKIWDHAPGALIVEEAGGKVTDIDGKPLDYTTGDTLSRNRGILASNGILHERILETIAKIEEQKKLAGN